MYLYIYSVDIFHRTQEYLTYYNEAQHHGGWKPDRALGKPNTNV